MADDISLKDFILEKFKALEKSTESARSAMEKRLDGMNEFRETLKDQAAKFVTRSELEILLERINEDVRILRESKAMIEGKASQFSLNVTMSIALCSLIISIVGMFIRR